MVKKKSFSFFIKLLYFINSILATLLLFAYLLPFLAPNKINYVSVLSLIVPVLIIVNFVFFIYWIVKLKKHFILSGTVLLVGWFFSSPFYKIGSKKVILTEDIKIMSYNVRMMNFYKHINKNNIDTKIIELISNNNPDILAIQEYYQSNDNKINYPYKYFVPKTTHRNFGLSIFSKFKIINKGSLNFSHSANNAIFVDVLKGLDTVRIYNVHLQSLKINPKKENFGEKNSKKLLDRLEKAFLQQMSQTSLLVKHNNQFKGKKIICGDFNNTAYSWVYHQLSKNKKDAFIEAGNGFGKSFNYFFPMRIDFILTDKNINVNYFQTFYKKYSDHYPIMARINWNK